jgi:hypothetical protein
MKKVIEKERLTKADEVANFFPRFFFIRAKEAA